MQVDYSEYNKIHKKRADHLECFMLNLAHAIEKCGEDGKATPQESMLHQLQCIGYSEEFAKDMCQVASDYKNYHLDRIRAEQIADQPAVKYPTIDPDRLEQYVENRELISAVCNHERSGELLLAIERAMEEERKDIFLPIDVSMVFKAYLNGDVDMLFISLIGNLEGIMAKAKIIPDEEELFYKQGDFPASEIAFPLHGKDSLTMEEFKEYLFDIHGIHDDTWKLVQSMLNFVKMGTNDEMKWRECLWTVLKDIGVPKEVVCMIKF